jgi:hypothetical protein
LLTEKGPHAMRPFFLSGSGDGRRRAKNIPKLICFASASAPCRGKVASLLSALLLSARCGVGRHGGADELPEGRFVDLRHFAQVDRTPRAAFQTGV